jgi:putative hydrolase of the HAD superfamily
VESSPIRLVCFDLGGVVIRICRSWNEACAVAGMPVRETDLWQQTHPDRLREVAEFQTGRIDAPTFAARLSEQVAGLYSPAEVLDVHHAWMLDEYAGVAELIDRVHDAGLDTAALSNTSHDHWVRIVGYPAVKRLRHLLASHLMGLHKPDPMIFRTLEQQLGYHAGEIIFFDDTPENVIAANGVGWRAHLIDSEADTAQQITAILREESALS